MIYGEKMIRVLVIVAAITMLHCESLPGQVFTQQYPSYPADEITGLIHWNGDTLFACAYNWNLLRSTDAGASWSKMLYGWPQANIVRMGADGRYLYLLPSATGFSQEGMQSDPKLLLLKYDPRSDVLDSIRIQRIQSDARFLWFDISVGHDAIAVLQAAGDTSALMLSTDGGMNWKTADLPVEYLHASNRVNTQLRFRDAKHGIMFVNIPPDISSGRHVFLTRDAGETWAPVDGVVQDYVRYATTPGFPAGWYDDSVAVIVHGRDTPVLTTDRGVSWNRASSIQGMIEAISFNDAGVGYIIDEATRVWKTTDYGIHWITCRDGNIAHPTGEVLSCIVQLGNDTVVTADFYGQIHRSTDGGLSWDRVHGGDIWEYRDLQFVSREVGYVKAIDRQYRNRRFLKTVDGGDTWLDHGDFPITGQDPVFHFIDETSAFAVRNFNEPQMRDSLIFRSTTGGSNWEPVCIRSYEDSIDINILVRGRWFSNADTGLVPLNGNRLLRTTDGGRTWEKISDFSHLIGDAENPRMEWIDTRGPASMWLVSTRIVFRSDDAGSNWNPVLVLPDTLPSNRGFSSVHVFTDGNVLVVSGNTNDKHTQRTYISTNNGETWEYQSVLGGADGVYFSTEKGIGMVSAGNYGYGWRKNLFSTSDGWNTRKLEWSFGFQNINSYRQMFFLDQMYGWVYGMNAIYRTTNGGVNWIDASPSLPETPRILSTWPQPIRIGMTGNVGIAISRPGMVRMELYDLLGRRKAVAGERYFETTQGNINWPTEGLQPGCYMLRILAPGGETWSRIILY